jgi:hypothetical protein
MMLRATLRLLMMMGRAVRVWIVVRRRVLAIVG